MASWEVRKFTPPTRRKAPPRVLGLQGNRARAGSRVRFQSFLAIWWLRPQRQRRRQQQLLSRVPLVAISESFRCVSVLFFFHSYLGLFFSSHISHEVSECEIFRVRPSVELRVRGDGSLVVVGV